MVEENPEHFDFLSEVVLVFVFVVHHTLTLRVMVYRLLVGEVYCVYRGS
jgi:hypothetical protein